MPSQAIDNFSYQKEESYRCSTASFIQEVGRALRLYVQIDLSVGRPARLSAWPLICPARMPVPGAQRAL